MIALHDYQQESATKGCAILRQYKIVYFSFQLRTGKTLISLRTAQLYLHDTGRVLFLTKKKAISSIEKDFKSLDPHFNIYVTNYESLHKITDKFDLIILDESHCLGQYPIPSKRSVAVKNICAGLPVIYLSGTPSPESFSQLFHQFFASSFTPFANCKNFYYWFKVMGCVKTEFDLGYGGLVPNYSNDIEIVKKYYDIKKRDISKKDPDYEIKLQKINADKGEAIVTANKAAERIQAATQHLFLSYTQEQAGFKEYVKEEILFVYMKPGTYQLAKIIKKDKVFTGKSGHVIVADSAVKEMSKLHQIFGGTVIDEEGEGIVFDDSKMIFIKERFAGKKIAIYYKFQAELKMIQKHYSNITHDPIEFNKYTDKIFVSQIVSGSQGINLSTADAMVAINVDFSYLQYFQMIARIQSKERTKECFVYWVFAKGGIEHEIYKRVLNKEDFTLAYYKDNIVMTDGVIESKTNNNVRVGNQAKMF